MTPRVIAIDGAAGSGKSTLARSLAAALDLPYVNTGLMYRALTAAALDARVPVEDEGGLVALTGGLRFSLEGSDPPELQVQGWSNDELVSLEVEANVSTVARHPGVRGMMRTLQRRLGSTHGAVMEGRDIGSVVFADAPVKLYLEADPRARGRRRSAERQAVVDVDDRSVAQALRRRDERDAVTTPHEPSEGAVVIDTTDLDEPQTLARALSVVRERAPEFVS